MIWSDKTFLLWDGIKSSLAVQISRIEKKKDSGEKVDHKEVHK